jgi:thiol-disulfide isomerase/thioredoxin
VLASLPPGARPEPFVINYGRELRNLSADERKELENLAAQDALARERMARDQRVHFPNFNAFDLERKLISPVHYRGKVVLVDFWASWSEHSMHEMPYLLGLYNLHPRQDFEIIGVNVDQDSERMYQALDAMGLPWRQISDPDGALAQRSGVQTVPARFLLDAEGRIINRDLSGANLRRAVERAVAANSAARTAGATVDSAEGEGG